jgi:hypothetical protein
MERLLLSRGNGKAAMSQTLLDTFVLAAVAELAGRLPVRSAAPDESYMVFDKYAFAGGVQSSRLFVSVRQNDSCWSEPIDTMGGGAP